MPPDTWCRVLSEAVELGAESVRFAGGEPTAHPAFSEILRHTIRARPEIEVVTDLIHVTRCHWTLFTHERVRLATRWYSDDPVQHEAITHRPDSHLRTRTNIVTALGLHIPLRVDIVETVPDQRIGAARAELLLLGVRPDRIVIDRRRSGAGEANSRNRSATYPTILANGDVVTADPSRHHPIIGNVLRDPLAEILAAPAEPQPAPTTCVPKP
ncbi:radical SAM/SPASM domain-containing protein [Embleya sp. MST-111070]|uniref:radical SAM/SPASM domain-containing protein n=1 Tax=Embleya sp. MST-111070 TaxID=3398231 RepID=UPI003F7344F9